MDTIVPNETIHKETNWVFISKIQGLWFTLSFILSLFAYPLSSYLSEFIGFENNILSIIARAFSVLTCIGYLSFLLIYRLFKPSNFFYLFLLFWILYSIRIIHDTFLYSFQLGRTPSEYYLFAFVLSFFCSIPMFNPVQIPWMILKKWVIIILVALNILGLYNNLTADNIFLERLGGNERLNPIAFGLQASLLIIISLIQILKSKLSIWLNLIFMILILISMINLLVSASKSPIIFLFLSLFLIIIYFIRMRNIRALIIVSSITVVVVAFIFALGLEDMILLAINRFTEIKQDESSYERMSMLKGGINQFLEYPLWGSFLEEKIWKEYPHNLILESFMTLGIVGGTIFLIFYISCWFVTIKNIYKSKLSVPSFICLSILTLSIFSGGLSFSSDFWIASASMFALNNQLKSTF